MVFPVFHNGKINVELVVCKETSYRQPTGNSKIDGNVAKVGVEIGENQA